MSVASKYLFKIFKKRIEQSGIRNIRWLSEGEQTQLSWANNIRSYDELPDEFKSFFNALPARDKKPFPYTVLMPTYKGYLNQEKAKLVCCFKKRITILESSAGNLTVINYPITDMLYAESGRLLLHCWVTIIGETSEHGFQSTTLKCNAVTEYILAPLVEMSRPAIKKRQGLKLESEREKFNTLVDQNYKFMNFAKNSLRTGEKVIQFILQPKIFAEIVKLFGRSLSWFITPAHLCLLTDSELIIIRDDASRIWQKTSPYGGIRTYIPLGNISSLSLDDSQEDFIELIVQLYHDREILTLFDPDKKPELETLVASYRSTRK